MLTKASLVPHARATLMQRSRTATTAKRTQTKIGRFSAVQVAHKDPAYDYAFRLRHDIEQGGGMDHYGFEPVSEANYAGETWGGPRSMSERSRGRKQIHYQDTVLCKRPLETARYFQQLENEKYNAQCNLVMTASRRAGVRLRELDPGAVVVNSSKGLDKAMPQRPAQPEEA